MAGEEATDRPATRGALATGLRVLEGLTDAHGPIGVTELAAKLALDKANVHRTLAVLVRFGYAEQDVGTRRYRPTFRVLELAHSMLAARELPAVAAPHLKALWAASHENTHLAVLSGDHVVYVSAINGPTLLSANAAIGQSGPLHCTATGKAILANLPVAARDALLAAIRYERFTPTTIAGPEALTAQLAAIRTQGFAIDDREYHPGVRCLAAPVWAIGGLVGSLGVSAPADRFDRDRVKALAPIVLDTAMRVSRELGGTPMRTGT